MHVFEQLDAQLNQLEQVVMTLTEEVYVKPVPVLYQASIGDHTRHIVEILQCAVQGHTLGVIDYHNRERDLALARDARLAMSRLKELKQSCRLSNKAVQVIYSASTKPEDEVLSTYYRELQYNVEHAIHHMALMKAAFFHLGQPSIHDDFGVAYATVAYREKG